LIASTPTEMKSTLGAPAALQRFLLEIVDMQLAGERTESALLDVMKTTLLAGERTDASLLELLQDAQRVLCESGALECLAPAKAYSSTPFGAAVVRARVTPVQGRALLDGVAAVAASGVVLCDELQLLFVLTALPHEQVRVWAAL
jgi:hypothetical protein